MKSTSLKIQHLLWNLGSGCTVEKIGSRDPWQEKMHQIVPI